MTKPKTGIEIRDTHVIIRFEKGEIAYDIILAIYSKYIHGTLKTIIRDILIKFIISNKDFDGDEILNRIKQDR